MSIFLSYMDYEHFYTREFHDNYLVVNIIFPVLFYSRCSFSVSIGSVQPTGTEGCTG